MKWASRISLFTMGAVLAYANTCPVSASPVVRCRGSHTGVSSPDGLSSVAEGGCGIEAFLAILANPAGAGIDEASAAYYTTQLNALKALSLSGLGGVGELTVADMDALTSIKLALGEMLDSQEAMLLEAQAAQDLLSGLLGVPMVGIDSLAVIDELAASGDLESLLASLLANDMPYDVTVGEAELAAATEAESGDSSDISFASSLGGGAWYGGHIMNGTGPIGGGNASSNSKTYGGGGGGGGGGSSGGGSSSHHAHHHLSSAAVAVPLPAGAWAGLVLLAVLGAGMKLRAVRMAI